ncbi:hypothetical protein [Streptobacillus moniliformis]|uniref:hypothetical protein n=1 Tax=Streptobacillus moniliformis TaxID=34105 RepID=UPI0007E2F621|nr:hypothetical protein [Streptobacillus moniliformis]
MINKKKFKASIVENGISVDEILKNLRISKTTFYKRLNNNTFKVRDIDKLIKLLKINDNQKFLDIFFDNFVA